MSPKRLKSTVLAALALLDLALLLAWTQAWIAVEVEVSGATSTVEATGETVAPALSALALAGLALIAALALAGPFFRIVLAVLQALLAACALLSSIVPLVDPLAAASPAATAVTGVTELSSAADPSVLPWPYLALVASALLLVVAVLVIVTSRRWPGSSRRYQAVRTAPVDPVDGPRDRVADWDAVTRGSDPTNDDGEPPQGGAPTSAPR